MLLLAVLLECEYFGGDGLVSRALWSMVRLVFLTNYRERGRIRNRTEVGSLEGPIMVYKSNNSSCIGNWKSRHADTTDRRWWYLFVPMLCRRSFRVRRRSVAARRSSAGRSATGRASAFFVRSPAGPPRFWVFQSIRSCPSTDSAPRLWRTDRELNRQGTNPRPPSFPPSSRKRWSPIQITS